MFAWLTIILAETRKKENKEEFKLPNIIQTERERERRGERHSLVSCTTENALSLHLKVGWEKCFHKLLLEIFVCDSSAYLG